MKVNFQNINVFMLSPETKEDGAILDNLADNSYKYIKIIKVDNDNNHIPKCIILKAFKD